MNFFQRAKLAFSLVFSRYEAAQTWRSDFTYMPGSVQDARFDASASTRQELLRLARVFEKNSALAQAIGSVFVDFTVGPTGLVMKPASSDKEWNKGASSYWNQTAQFIDLSSRQNFGTLQGMISWRWLFDGEIFLLKTRGQSGGRTFPRIQLIESHRISTPPDLYAQEGKTIIDGVQIDSDGRPVGYHVKASSDSTAYRLVDAKDMIHVFEPSRPGEYRGITFFHAVIDDMRRLLDLELLEMRAAIDAAEKSTFFTNAAGELPIAKMYQQRLSGTGGTGESASADLERRIDYYKSAVGGRMAALKTGEDVKQFQPTRPTEATRAMWDYLLTKVCIGIGIPKLLVMQYSLQGTVVRGTYDVADAFFKARSAVIAAACREVYIYTIGSGKNNDQRIADAPADWFNVSIRPPRSVNVDVGRNSAAMVNELKSGCTNYDLIYSPLGLDWQEELTKLHEQIEFVHTLCSTGKTTIGEMIEAVAASQEKQAALQQAEQQKQQQDDTLV